MPPRSSASLRLLIFLRLLLAGTRLIKLCLILLLFNLFFSHHRFLIFRFFGLRLVRFFRRLGFLQSIGILQLDHVLKCLESWGCSSERVSIENSQLLLSLLSSVGIGVRGAGRLVLRHVDIHSFDALVGGEDEFFGHLAAFDYLIDFLVHILIYFFLELRYDLLFINRERMQVLI